MRQILLAMMVGAMTVGCSNPYLNPSVSKAVAENEQTAESKKQTLLMERQTVALDKLAACACNAARCVGDAR